LLYSTSDIQANVTISAISTYTNTSTGLSQRANHPRDQLKLLHGSLFDIKCFNCDYIELNNYDDPFHPLLAIDTAKDARLAAAGNTIQARIEYMDPNINTATINPDDLPHCPECKTGLLRPGVVWFGEALPVACKMMPLSPIFLLPQVKYSEVSMTMLGLKFSNPNISSHSHSHSLGLSFTAEEIH
jgi:NAD-dependent SIR2 family protein deacetylase